MSTAIYTDETPTDPDDELLVAYLDGELPREERDHLENRLVDDQSLRSRLNELQLGWDMLEALPDETPSINLVETTLELAIADVNKHQPPTKRWLKYKPWLIAALLGCATLAAAFGLSKWSGAVEYQNQLRDLAIAQYYEAYNRGADLGLMRTLAANPEWNRVVATTRELRQGTGDEITLSQIPINQRDEAIQSMTTDQRQQLKRNWNSWINFTQETKDSLRRTALAAGKQEDSDSLMKTMRSYATWRETLNDELIDQIESSDEKTRRQGIEEAIEQSRGLIARLSGAQLDEENVERIWWLLTDLLRKRREASPRQYLRLDEMQRRSSEPAAVEWYAIRKIFGTPDPRMSRMSRSDRSFEPPRFDEISQVAYILDDNARDTLDLVCGGDPMIENLTLKFWIDEVIERKSPYTRDSAPLERYQELEPSEREDTELLPPDQFMKTLQRDRWGGPPPPQPPRPPRLDESD